jgi:catechol 2,3-dioxygenase-like lactoylglutathione lyase family enzyme
VLGHVGINVADLAVAKRYYDVIMSLVGFEEFLVHDDEFAYRPKNNKPGTFLFFYPAADPAPYAPTRTGLQHLAFMVRTRGAVHAVHDRVVDLGSTVLHAPQVFPQYPQPYHATFWLDPFGMMLEAVCHYDRD